MQKIKQKNLVLLCAIILGVSLFSGCAEKQVGLSTDPADYESMVFNNTPWGSSLEEVEKLYGELTPLDSESDEFTLNTYTVSGVSVFGFAAERVEFVFLNGENGSYLMTTHTTFQKLSLEEYEKLQEMIESVTDESLLEQTTGDLSEEENERINANVEKYGLNEMVRDDTSPRMNLYNIEAGYYSSGDGEKDLENGLSCYLDFGATVKLLSERVYE